MRVEVDGTPSAELDTLKAELERLGFTLRRRHNGIEEVEGLLEVLDDGSTFGMLDTRRGFNFCLFCVPYFWGSPAEGVGYLKKNAAQVVWARRLLKTLVEAGFEEADDWETDISYCREDNVIAAHDNRTIIVLDSSHDYRSRMLFPMTARGFAEAEIAVLSGLEEA